MISQQQLDAFSCQDCFLVVSVIFPAETPETFSIEITQQVSALTNGMMKHHFLLAGSMAYY